MPGTPLPWAVSQYPKLCQKKFHEGSEIGDRLYGTEELELWK